MPGFLIRQVWLIIFGLGYFPLVSAEEPQILVSIKPLGLITEAIINGTPVQVKVLLPANVSPHQYSLKPSDIRQLNQADLVIWLGEDYEPYIKLGKQQNIQMLSVISSTFLIKVIGEHDNHRVKKHAGGIDPHFWLDPALAVQAAEVISVHLAKQFPAYQVIFINNLENFKQSVQVLDQTVSSKATLISGKPFLVYHRAYDYFFKHYGIEGQAGVVHERLGTGLGVKKLNALEKRLPDSGTICLFNEPQFISAKLPGFLEGRSVTNGELDPMGMKAGTYGDLIESLINQMVMCINASEG